MQQDDTRPMSISTEMETSTTPICNEVPNSVRVGAHSTDDASRLLLRKVPQAQLLKVFVEVRSQVPCDVFTEHRHGPQANP